MKTFMMAALGAVVLAVGGAVWFAGSSPPPVIVDPEPLITDPPFDYPLELWDQGIEGDALVMVHVNRAGAVDSAYVLQSSGQPAFDSAAVDGVQDIAFRPGRSDDEAVDAWVRLPVRFRLPADPLPADVPR